MLYRVSVWFFLIWMKFLHFLKVFGQANIPKDGSFICASNHVSLGDPPVLGVAFSGIQLAFMAKQDLFDNKRWGWWFHGTQCIPISRNRKDIKATKEAVRRIRKGWPLAVFPEGTRSEDGEFKQAENGVAFLSAKTGAPVIPVFVDGTQQALPKGGKYKAWMPVNVYIGEKVNFSGAESIENKREKYAFMSNKIMMAIAELKKNSITGKILK